MPLTSSMAAPSSMKPRSLYSAWVPGGASSRSRMDLLDDVGFGAGLPRKLDASPAPLDLQDILVVRPPGGQPEQ